MAERHSDKSPDAFRTISEVADHLDLPQHVLRFWETRFPEIKPVKRAGGRRFYRPEDIDLLRAIRHLLYAEGYTIKGVQKILKDQGARHIQAIGADLLDGRPVELGRTVPELPSGNRGGLLGSLLPGRRNKNEARLIADASGPAYDEVPYEEEPGPQPAYPVRSESRGPLPTERAAPGRAVRAHEAEDAAPRPRRAAERPDPGFDAPDAFLPGFEMPARAEPVAGGMRPSRPAEPDFDAFEDYPDDRIGREPRFDDVRPEPYRGEPHLDYPPARSPVPAAPVRVHRADDFPPMEPEPERIAPSLEAKPAPATLRRPTRGPASRVADPAPAPELEDPLLPFFDDDVLTPPEETISEPLNERIRRLKDHVPPAGAIQQGWYGASEDSEQPAMRSARQHEDGARAPGRVGPLTGVFPEDEPHAHEPYRRDAYGHEPYPREPLHEADDRYPAEPRRQGPPEQYLPPHLRSEPRMTAAPLHAPQPVLSRDDMHRLQSALYELGECRRLLTESLRSEES